MNTLYDVGTQTFSWRPVKGVKKTIEVYAGADIFGTLRQERGQPTIATTAEGRWTIEKTKGTLTVRADGGATIATFVTGTGGEGTVTLADGQTLRWAPTTTGQAERAFYDDAGRRIVRFWKDWQFLKVEDRGEADPGMAAWPGFPVLVVLGRVIGIGADDGTGDGGAMVAIMGAIAV